MVFVKDKRRSYLLSGLALVTLAVLYYISLKNFLLFHALAEGFSICIAFCIFVVAWNSRQFSDNDYLLFIGCSLVFVAFLDLIHLFAYKGMNIFGGLSANPATQLWIAARYMESISLLIAPFWLTRKLKMNIAALCFSVVTALVLAAVFYWPVFPDCFVAGSGLTRFKKASEYIICLILGGALVLLRLHRHQMDEKVNRLIAASIVVTILAELCFTFYVSVYGFSNISGHVLKIISFYLIYKAIVENGLKRPYDTLFRDLKESEERYQQIFETNQAVKLLIDPENGDIVEANQAACDFYGYSKEEILTKKITDINMLPPDEVRREMKCAKTVGRLRFSFPHRLASGEVRDVHVYSGPVKTSAGNLLFSIIHDVTDQKRAEEQLRESEKRFNLAMDASRDGIFDWDLVTNEIYYSPGWKKMLGYEYDELPSDFSVWERLTHPDDVERSWHMQKELISGKRDRFEIEFKMKHKDGHWVDILSRANAYFNENGKAVRIVGTHLDISQRKKIEEALKESRERYQKAQRIGKVGNWEYNIQTTEFWGSDEAKRIYGFDPRSENFTTEEVERCIPERERVHQALIDLLEKGKAYHLEFDIITRDTQERKTIISIAKLEKDAEGNPLRVTGVIQDITKRKQSEMALRKSEARLYAVFEAADKISFIITDAQDPEPLILEFSPGAEKIFGYARAEMIGKPLSVLHLPEDATQFPTAHQRMGEGKGGFSGETTLVRKSGKKFPALFSTYPMYDEAGEMYAMLAVSIDISEQKEMELKLLQAHKMEAIGNLAGGIAHEFNNVLAIILGNAELAIDDVPDWNPAHNALKEICNASFRAKEVVLQILSFARKTMTALKPLEINAIAKESLKLMRASIPTMIDIQSNIPPEPSMILGDPTEIHQILINLFTNASYAMKEKGGVLEIEISEVALDNIAASRYEDLSAGDFVKLAVHDSGEGIKPDVLEKAFEPYFTTKEFGAGSGMGLAVVYGIVKKCKGAINIKSTVGEGTTVEVLFPRIEEKEPSNEKKEDELPMGNERILLVDDDPAIANMIGQILERLGYAVSGMTDSTAALERFQASPEDFDLVITDMAMPKMSGSQLAAELKKLRNNIPIFLCTGHSDTIDEKKAKELGIEGFSMKPLDKGVLARAVRTILDQNHNP